MIDRQKLIQLGIKAGHGKALAMIAVVFSFLYHTAFLILFYAFDVSPMFCFNIFSVTLFMVLMFVTARSKKFTMIYSLSLLEVVVHQVLAIYFLGGNSAFYFLIISMGFLGILIIDHAFWLTIIYGLAATCVCAALAILSPYIEPVYVIPDNVMLIIRCVNIIFGIFLIYYEIILFTFRATNVEDQLEFQVEAKTRELEQKNKKVYDLQNNMINSLASLVENRDSDTGGHIERTAAYVELIGRKAVEKGVYKDTIDSDFVDLAKRAAPMHDIGKIVIEDSILKKPGRLTDEEFSRMKVHTSEGKRIIAEIMEISENKLYVDMASDVAAYHHERWDGKGYPNGLSHEEIPVAARIMAIADVFDALVSERCYKKPMTPEQAFNIIKEESGSHFDPELAELFLSNKDDVIKIFREEQSTHTS